MLQLVLEKLPLASKAGLVNLWHAERFPWHATFIVVSSVVFLLPYQRFCVVKNVYVYICMYICIFIYLFTQ